MFHHAIQELQQHLQQRKKSREHNSKVGEYIQLQPYERVFIICNSCSPHWKAPSWDKGNYRESFWTRPKPPKARLTRADVGAPVQIEHLSHVGFDPHTGDFNVRPLLHNYYVKMHPAYLSFIAEREGGSKVHTLLCMFRIAERAAEILMRWVFQQRTGN